MDKRKDLMTPDELADYLKVDTAIVYQLIEEGEIPALQIGDQWRFQHDHIDEWLDRQHEDSNPKEILIVGDDETMRNLFRNILLQNGYSVSLAGSGEEALDHLKSNRPQLIIVDLEMPVMTGIEVCYSIKSQFNNKIPVALFTGHLSAEAAIDAIVLGVNGCIKKPLDCTDDLIQTIEKLLSRNQKKKKPLIVDLEELQKRIDELEGTIIVYEDFGVYTSIYFRRRLEEEFERAQRYSSLLSLAILSVKFTNGRGANGNEHLLHYSDLQKLSQFTSDSLRTTDVIGLLDKNTIGVILTETHNNNAVDVAQRIANNTKNLLFPDKECRVDIGVASYPTHANSVEELLEKSMFMLEQTRDLPVTE